MYLLLHNLATNRFARLGAVLVLVLVLAIVIALSSRHTHAQTKTTAVPACVSQPDTAATQDCVIQLFNWCKVNEPTVEASKCGAAVLTEAAIQR
ncbi:hypothetical protein [Streptacidiphilus pinicola]|uniref:hypothetical protein n=1 Tax=Streptacidiphilus pinicola TaxID=2219663 RepID=UPI0014022E1E|nr:hypothetical protein [Streptacidiphilus pinicola]